MISKVAEVSIPYGHNIKIWQKNTQVNYKTSGKSAFSWKLRRFCGLNVSFVY